jgi:hypothetical protein
MHAYGIIILVSEVPYSKALFHTQVLQYLVIKAWMYYLHQDL